MRQRLKRIFSVRQHYGRLFFKSKTKMLLIDSSTDSIIDINSAAADFFGHSAEELIGLKIDRSWYSKLSEQKSENKKQQNKYIIKVKVRDTEKYLDVFDSPIDFPGSTLHCVIIHDITDRVQTEKKTEAYKNHLERLVEERTNELKCLNEKLLEDNKRLKQTEEKLKDQLGLFATVLDTVPVPIFIRDKDKIYIECNNFFESFTGRSRDEIIGRHVSEIVKEPFASKYAEMDNELLNKKNIQSYEYKFPNSQGDIRDVIFNKAALVKSDGETVGVVGSFHDITEIKNALESEKELGELKTRFISTASHEFRTPLTAILSSADLLMMHGRSWPEDKYLKHISNIRRSVKYMTELLEDILTMSRADSGKMVFAPEDTDLREVCSEVAEAVRVKATENHILKINCMTDRDYFYIDNKLVKQILSNLLSNAIKYSPSGGTVQLDVDMKDERLLFSVSDEGIGIPDEEKKNLMTPFYRTKNAETIPGTGLGLSIVKKSVELHGGEIYFESRVDKGSIFTVLIPMQVCFEI